MNRWLGNRGRFVARRAALPDGVAAARGSSTSGCGSGDVPAVLRGRSRAAWLAVGVDIKLLHLQAAPRELLRVVADVRAPALRAATPSTW